MFTLQKKTTTQTTQVIAMKDILTTRIKVSVCVGNRIWQARQAEIGKIVLRTKIHYCNE